MESHQQPSSIITSSATPTSSTGGAEINENGSGGGGSIGSAIGGNNIGEIFENNTDPYEIDNGTVKFIGSGSGGIHGIDILNDHSNNIKINDQKDYMTIKVTNSNQKLRSEQFTKTELLNMLCRLEGELQARDVVIATLRNERVKQLIHNLRNQPKILLNDPHAALFRDKMASAGHLVSRQSSVTAIQGEMELRAIIEQQMESLYKMVTKQRTTQAKMVTTLKDSLDNNQKMRQELEDEKRKHEHDTAQGDDITYGLEIERTKLKQELESERTQRKKLEKDLKKIQEQFDFERGRQKQIVLLLLAERKKIIMKYIEERKRSEDLAQILSEEKQQKDSMADGLEEETKKSLRMEAELERQASQFEQERKLFTFNLAKEEKRIKELEIEIAQLKSVHMPAVGQVISTKIRSIPIPTGEIRNPSSVIDVAKIVQPTATVSSVPVSGPTTGIARSVNSTVIGGFNSPATKITPRKQVPTPISQSQQQQQQQPLVQQQPQQQPSQQQQQQQIQNLSHNQANNILTNTSLSSCVLAVTSSAVETISQNKTLGIGGGTGGSGSGGGGVMGNIGGVIGMSTGGGGGVGVTGIGIGGSGGKVETINSTTIIATSNSSFIGNSFIGNVKPLTTNNTMNNSKNQVTTTTNINNMSINNTTGTLINQQQQQQQQQQQPQQQQSSLQNNIPTTGITSIPIVTGLNTGNNSTTSGVGSGGGGGIVGGIGLGLSVGGNNSNNVAGVVGSTTGNVARGVPPPIPPNKPVVPPKREPSISRLGSSISTSNIK